MIWGYLYLRKPPNGKMMIVHCKWLDPIFRLAHSKSMSLSEPIPFLSPNLPNKTQGAAGNRQLIASEQRKTSQKLQFSVFLKKAGWKSEKRSPKMFNWNMAPPMKGKTEVNIILIKMIPSIRYSPRLTNSSNKTITY